MENFAVLNYGSVGIVILTLFILAVIDLILIYQLTTYKDKLNRERRRRRVSEAVCDGYKAQLVEKELTLRQLGVKKYIEEVDISLRHGGAEPPPSSDAGEENEEKRRVSDAG